MLCTRGILLSALIAGATAVAAQGMRPRDADDPERQPPAPGAPLAPCDSASAEWIGGGWSHRVRITVPPDSIAGAGELHDFTVLLPLESYRLPGVFVHGKPDGSDLVVTRCDGVTPLPLDRVSYGSGFAELWFRADTLSPQANIFYLYYGNPDTSIAPDGGPAWDADYLGVYHFEGDPGAGVLADHAQHGDDALPMNGWTSSDTTAGVIGQAWRMDGAQRWIDGDALACADSSETVSAWLAIEDPLTSGTDFAFQSETGYWNLSAKRNDLLRYPDINTQNGFIVWDCDPQPDGRLHQFVWMMDGVQDTVRFFFDGEEQSILVHYAPHPPHRVCTGLSIGGNVGILSPAWGNPPDLFRGIVDEYRVLRGTRSPEWIRTEFRNQRSGGAFFVFGDEQHTGVPESDLGVHVAIRAFPNPACTGTAIRFRVDALERGRLEVLDPAGRRIRAFAFTTTADGFVREPWDAALPGGVYLLRAVSEREVREGRVIVIR